MSIKKYSGIISLKRLSPLVKSLQRRGKKVAFTNGCFDLLHIGHLALFDQIKRHSDYLIVAVNSDQSVRCLNKGRHRPIMPEKERARLVAALKPVDFVIIFSEDTPERLIRSLRPDLLAKGGDWKTGHIVGADIVKSWGGRVMRIPYIKGRSTTRLIERIRK